MGFDKWHKYKLGDLVDNQRGISYGIVQPGTFQKSGVPIVKVNNLTERKIAFKDLDKVSREIESKYQRTRLKGNEILISLVGTLGHVHLVDDSMINWNVARAIGVIPIDDKFDKNWVYWFLKSPYFQETIRNVASTSVQATLNLKELNEIEVLYPPDEAERLKITNILTALDDKIELNRRMNETLEGIAQAIWGEWFGKYANGEEDLPEGWRWGKMEDITETKGGTTPSTAVADYWNGEINWTSPRDLSSLRFPVLLDTEKKITEKGLKQISSGLLPIGTLLLSSRAPIGYLAMTQVPVAINQGYIAINCLSEYSNLFMLFWLKANMEKVIERANGSTFLEISKSNFREIEILLPDQSTHAEFVNLVSPIFEKIVENELQSKSLTAIRNVLLPKLMTGQIEI